MKKLTLVFTFILLIGMGVEAVNSVPDKQAVQWRDTLYVRIADSVFLESERALVFSLQIYRPNEDWNNDIVLGDFDFYFSYSNKAFNASTSSPSFDELLDAIDQGTGGRRNLLLGYTYFYAGRYGICGRADNTPGAKYVIPHQRWVDLCRVKIPMAQADQNPGIRWDLKATGAMTAGGNPIILKLEGDVVNNPKATVKAAGLTVMPQMQCQGEDVYVYVRDAVTSGTGLTYTWRDSVAGETWHKLGDFEATTAVKTGSSKDGRYQFEVLGAGDTLVIKNSPGIADGLFLNCTLSDASVDAAMMVDTVVRLRDSLWGYLASTESADYGMHSGIDTVKKCPGAPAALRLVVFGPTREEMQGTEEFGNEMMMYYSYLDEDLNTQRDSLKVIRTQLFKGYKGPATNKLNQGIFVLPWTTEHTGKIWVESIRTDYCNNGASYAVFDTLVIEEVEGNLSYNLEPLAIGVKEQIDLDTIATTAKSYEIFLKHDPSPIGGAVVGSNGANDNYIYYAGEAAGVDTIYYQYKVGECTMKAYRNVEVVENSYLTMKVLLEGPYQGLDDKGRDTMDCTYTTKEFYGENVFQRNNVGRLQSPYDDECLLDVSVRKISDIKTSSTITDWVYIRLREVILKDGVEAPGLNYIDSLSAFVLQDGNICGLNGEPVKFKNLVGTKVYVEVQHRNHLKVLSSKSKVLPTKVTKGSYDFDFTDKNQVWEGEQVLVLKSGKYCLVAGDLDFDGFLGVSDKVILTTYNGLTQYQYDIDGDGFVGVLDKKYITSNNGKYARP